MITGISYYKLFLFISVLTSLSACGPTSFTAKTAPLENRSNPDAPVMPTIHDEQPTTMPPTVPVPVSPTVPNPARVPVAIKPAPVRAPEVTAEIWKKALQVPLPAWAKKAQGESWSTITHQALVDFGGPMLSTPLADAADFCPKYNSLAKLERAKVWVQILSVMAQFESSFKWWTSFSEGFTNSKGEAVISRGLLQISRESANSYGCGILLEAQLDDPTTNLRCGVRIMNTLVAKYRSIHGRLATPVNGNGWMGGARYWSVLRWNNKDAIIRAATRRLPQCS